MSVYEPLTRFLKSYPGSVWNASFAEIERITHRSLPKSAYDHRPWWANQKGGNHSQSKAWQDAGFETSEVNLSRRTVRFERRSGGGLSSDTPSPIGGERSGGPDLDALFQKAAALTGERDRAALMARALEALIQREAAQYLQSLGGSDPDAEAPRRRRFPWES